MGLRERVTSWFDERGIEIPEGELDSLLSDDGSDTTPSPDGDVLAVDLPGEASGAVELFLSRDSIGLDKPIESEGDGLMWEPIIREGQWAVRPGGKTGKRRVPLKVVAGHSKNQRKEIGLADIKDAFDDDAIEYVTVPTSHNNHVLENTGFIKGLKIVEGTVKAKRKASTIADPKRVTPKVAVLMGGYDIKIPTVKEKMNLGTIASRSAGILYDYVNTETGKTYPVALEHVALTNKPWITGMESFGRKLATGKALSTVALSLSDDEPADEDFLAQDNVLDGIELSIGDGEELSWAKDESPNWLRGQVNRLLSDARSEKVRAARKTQPANSSLSYVDYDYPPNYRCVEAKPGMALIADGYEYSDNETNFWSAPIEVKDGAVSIAEFSKWEALKKDYVPDERPAPSKDKLPLDQEQTDLPEPPKRTRLQLAQDARKARFRGGDTPAGSTSDAEPTSNQYTHPRGGEHMSETGENALQLSEEARRIVEEAKAEAAAATERAEKLSQQVDRLVGTVGKAEADAYIAELKAANFSEENGWGGVLTVVRNIMLADDGEPALQSESFSEDGTTSVELSVTDAVKMIFAAVKRGEDGKIALGEQVTEPPEKPAEGGTGDKANEGEAGTTGQKLSDGKPGPGGSEEKPFEELSDEEQIEQLRKDHPELADHLPTPAGAGTDTGKGGAS